MKMTKLQEREIQHGRASVSEFFDLMPSGMKTAMLSFNQFCVIHSKLTMEIVRACYRTATAIVTKRGEKSTDIVIPIKWTEEASGSVVYGGILVQVKNYSAETPYKQWPNPASCNLRASLAIDGADDRDFIGICMQVGSERIRQSCCFASSRANKAYVYQRILLSSMAC